MGFDLFWGAEIAGSIGLSHLINVVIYYTEEVKREPILVKNYWHAQFNLISDTDFCENPF